MHILWPSIPAYPGYVVVENVAEELSIIAIQPPLPSDDLVRFFGDQIFVSVKGPGDIEVVVPRFRKSFRRHGENHERSKHYHQRM